MLTVLDIIHLIQYYYATATYDSAASDVDRFKLESLRGELLHAVSDHPNQGVVQISRRPLGLHLHRCYTSILLHACLMLLSA